MSIDVDVTEFARLQAVLRRPFTRREDALLAAGLTERTLAEAQRAWAVRLAEEDAAALREEFRAAFSGERRERDVPEPVIVSDASAPGEPVEPVPPIPRVVPSYLQPGEADLEKRLARIRYSDADATRAPTARPGPTLPFVETAPGTVPDAVRAQLGASRRDLPSLSADGDETALLPTAALAGLDTESSAHDRQGDALERGTTVALDPAVAAAAAATPEPWISLEDYVAFLAELAKDPRSASHLRAQFGIASEEAQRVLGAAFASRFALDPSERARFDKLLRQARARSSG